MDKKMSLAGKTILVTGGTGSWGHELVSQLLERSPDVREIRIYSRGEHRQVVTERAQGRARVD